jgi:hypothetical protein
MTNRKRVLAATSLALSILAVPSARAAGSQELVANAHASSVGGCSCGPYDDKTVMTTANNPLHSNATDAPAGSSSYAHADVTTKFGTQKAYADAFLAAGDTNPDAQANAFSRYIEYFAPGTFSGTVNLTIVITGTHTPNAGVIGPGTDAELTWIFKNETTNFDIASGNWSATDAAPVPVTASFAVPISDVTSLQVDFSVSAYAGPRVSPYKVVADYSDTVHTYLDVGAGAPDVVGVSGHDYATNASVPEPGSWVMLVAGLGVAGAGLRRARRGGPDARLT